MSKLALLLEIRILRYSFSYILPSTKIELHGFCDTSVQSYADVINNEYVDDRTIDVSSEQCSNRVKYIQKL